MRPPRHVAFSSNIQFFQHSSRTNSFERNLDELNDAGKSVYFDIYSSIKKLPEKTEDETRKAIKNKWNNLTDQKKRDAHLDFAAGISDALLIDNEWIELTNQEKQAGLLRLLNEWIESFVGEQVAPANNRYDEFRKGLLNYDFNNAGKDGKYCKTEKDKRKLSRAALQLKTVIDAEKGKNTLTARIAILEAKLVYREVLYSIRRDNGYLYTSPAIFHFFRLYASAEKKLHGVYQLQLALDNLKKSLDSNEPVSFAVISDKSVHDGKLGKCYQELQSIAESAQNTRHRRFQIN